MHDIVIKTGDITLESSCAIVNAANASLLGGGGVDGAIHRAGGGAILEACRAIRQKEYPEGLPTGEAITTTAGNMKAKYVIHTVGPIYSQCGSECAKLLSASYANSLKQAVKHGCNSVAFPAISTGIYGYPKDEAARIAYEAVTSFLDQGFDLQVRFVFHSKANEADFIRAIKKEE